MYLPLPVCYKFLCFHITNYHLFISAWKTFSICCEASLVVMDFHSFCLSWKVFKSLNFWRVFCQVECYWLAVFFHPFKCIISLSPGSFFLPRPALGSPDNQVPGFLTPDPFTAMVFSLQFLSLCMTLYVKGHSPKYLISHKSMIFVLKEYCQGYTEHVTTT